MLCLLGPVRQKEGRETGQVLFFHNCQWGSPDFNKGTTPPPPSPHLRPCCALWPEPHRQPRRLRSTPGPEPHVASSECWHAWTRTPYCKVRMLWARLGPNTWHIFWQSIWHSFWHSVWHMFWHSIWQSFWHSISHVFGSSRARPPGRMSEYMSGKMPGRMSA